MIAFTTATTARRVALAVAALTLLPTACSDDASTDAAESTLAPSESSASAATSAPTATGGGTKVLVADGSHWGCPGAYCGPTVSRFSATRYDATDAVTVQKGTEVTAECHTTGAEITDDVTDTSTSEWVRVTGVDDGHVWMSAHYFGTADFASVVDGLPPC